MAHLTTKKVAMLSDQIKDLIAGRKKSFSISPQESFTSTHSHNGLSGFYRILYAKIETYVRKHGAIAFLKNFIAEHKKLERALFQFEHEEVNIENVKKAIAELLPFEEKFRSLFQSKEGFMAKTDYPQQFAYFSLLKGIMHQLQQEGLGDNTPLMKKAVLPKRPKK